MIRTIRHAVAGVATLTAVATPTLAVAALVFDFEGVVLSGGTGNNAAVQTYINSVVGGAGIVTVKGAVADRAYNGDNHAYKPNGQYMTLGTTDGATSLTDTAKLHPGRLDTYIRNVGGEGATNTAYGILGNDKFIFDFLQPIYFVSFDWEVFPDAACNNTCSPTSPNYPDFELWAGTATTRLYTFGVASFPVVDPPGSNNYPQGLGHFSASFATGVTHLEFVDWPARIGIDRLDPVTVPEPATASLVAFALAGLGLARRKALAAARKAL